MPRYAAKLLFGHQVLSKFGPFTEDTIVITASGPASAMKRFRKIGKQKELSYLNDEGQTVRYRFLGITDASNLSICDEDTMWFDIHTQRPRLRSDKKLLDLLR